MVPSFFFPLFLVLLGSGWKSSEIYWVVFISKGFVILFYFWGCTVVAFWVVLLGVSSLGHTQLLEIQLQMMAEDGLTLPSSIRGFVQEPNSNPNPNPSANPVKKKRNLPGTPGKNDFTLLLHTFLQFFCLLSMWMGVFTYHLNWVFILLLLLFSVLDRSRSRSHRSITKITHGHEPIHL